MTNESAELQTLPRPRVQFSRTLRGCLGLFIAGVPTPRTSNPTLDIVEYHLPTCSSSTFLTLTFPFSSYSVPGIWWNKLPSATIEIVTQASTLQEIQTDRSPCLLLLQKWLSVARRQLRAMGCNERFLTLPLEKGMPGGAESFGSVEINTQVKAFFICLTRSHYIVKQDCSAHKKQLWHSCWDGGTRSKNLFFPSRLIPLVLGCQAKFLLGWKQGLKRVSSWSPWRKAWWHFIRPWLSRWGKKTTLVIILPIS